MRKQTTENSYFVNLWANIGSRISAQEVADLIATAREEIANVTHGQKAAIAWSGGKDSLALDLVSRPLGITQGVLGLCYCEYPEMEAWYAAHLPAGVEIVRTPQDLNFLREHPEMLFPQNSTTLSRWYQIKQIRAQEVYCERNHIDVILLGRRREEGNYIGPGPHGTHRKKGTQTTIYCPIRDWTHRQVLGVLHYAGVELPPNYGWPNGFTIGSGSWPVNNFAKDGLEGWQYVYDRDPSVVTSAALAHLPGAAQFLSSLL